MYYRTDGAYSKFMVIAIGGDVGSARATASGKSLPHYTSYCRAGEIEDFISFAMSQKKENTPERLELEPQRTLQALA